LPRADFVNFLQNHDQIGNRPKGERLAVLAKPEALAAALALLLLQPGPPLMFMGDEWGTRTPFPFFCDFKSELAEAVRMGRRREFAEAYAEYGDEIPDPLSQETRKAAVLDWTELREPAVAARLALTRELLTVRRRQIMPLLPAMTNVGQATFDNDVLCACWRAAAKNLMLVANLSDERRPNPVSPLGEPLWGGVLPRELSPWTVYAGLRVA
jgi:maltooligosyltrehalose trehalohydrolase